MIETWLLIMVLASGELAIVPKTTALACDAERGELIREVAAAEMRGVCPRVVAADCVSALATPEFLEEDAR